MSFPSASEEGILTSQEDRETPLKVRWEDILWGRLGGHAAVQAAVEIFYRKLLGDVRVAHFFNDISIDRLKAKQACSSQGETQLTLCFSRTTGISCLIVACIA